MSRWAHVNVTLLSFAIPLFSSLAGIRFVVYLPRMLFSPDGLAVWERMIAAIVWSGVALYLAGALPEILDLLGALELSVGAQRFFLLSMLESVFWILATPLLAMWVGRGLEFRLMSAESMHYGEVRKITTRFTVVRSLTGVEALIPNDTILTSTVLSNTYADKRLRLTVEVSVAYSTDAGPVLLFLADIARRNDQVLADPARRPSSPRWPTAMSISNSVSGSKTRKTGA